MTTKPAQFCAHADANGDADRCPCRYTAGEHLTCARLNLLDARTAARQRCPNTERVARSPAAELADKISDAIAHVERLRVVVEGDERAEQASAQQAAIQ